MSLTRSTGYSIRRFRRSDREAYADLLDRVRGDDPGGERFAWKFEENPALDRVPVHVAERSGELVGAVALWPLRMRLGEATRIALQPCEPIVHPDYRDRGLSALLLGEALDAYGEGEPAFCVDFSDGSTRNGPGWSDVDRLSTYYRVHDPGALVGVGEPLAAAGRVAAKGYLAACDRIAPETESLSVDRYEGVPIETFADLYRRQVPAAIHALRDESFYRWRFGNPDWEYEAYVVRRDGDPAAGAVVASRRRGPDGYTVARVVDRVPMVLEDGELEASLLEAIVSARSDADVVATHQDAFSHRTLSRFGFQREDAFPFSRAPAPTTFGVRSLRPGDAGPINGFDPTDRTDWLVGFAERGPA